jgi:hypothetical protein
MASCAVARPSCRVSPLPLPLDGCYLVLLFASVAPYETSCRILRASRTC